MRLVRSDGQVLDATFTLATSGASYTLIYESSGGRAGGPNPRNLDYREGLETLLARLAELDVVVHEIRVDTERTASLPVNLRRIASPEFDLPLRISSFPDLGRLRRAISAAARKIGQTTERAARGGGSSRRMSFVFDDPSKLNLEDLSPRLAGGGASGEVDQLRTLIDVAAGRTAAGQGFLVSQALRTAIEGYAVKVATKHYCEEGWDVRYVGDHEPFDLHCARGDDYLHVEVKRTATPGEVVILTPNEVAPVRANHPASELFVVFGIRIALSGDSAPIATGGSTRRMRMWSIHDRDLRPLGFQYRLP